MGSVTWQLVLRLCGHYYPSLDEPESAALDSGLIHSVLSSGAIHHRDFYITAGHTSGNRHVLLLVGAMVWMWFVTQENMCWVCGPQSVEVVGPLRGGAQWEVTRAMGMLPWRS